ncbi:MAG: nitric oxide reductase transcriptional regulator NorR [Pseudomonadales bacterium]|uniref:GAF sensor-containing signal transduction transcription regulator n=1 Tax=Oleiphilus messinensis TaxID=141451 RepID=A0A1Y0I5C4_9GAMM|nr:nitric oxide reductase transcriptional regulator NorR [Oleiphilus messinensis]ARU54735.1 GAF sensor-containing signal transduction transcription regulator [Oleiphilus messinensis]MCG8609999.1 nitric oxide reductase transcriptional regulator NorR [Pseudomonadales bacterium]
MITPRVHISTSTLLDLAIDMATSVTAEDRFERLLNTVRGIIQCDAVVMLQRQGERLKPLAQKGLVRDVLGRRFDIQSHPRFTQILNSTGPVRFASDCDLPDPYDGMVHAYEGNLPVHACMGLPLRSNNEVIGLLTLDSLTPGCFDSIPERTLEIIAAMAAACLNTAMLLEKLEAHTQHVQRVVCELTEEALTKDGGEIIGHSQVMNRLREEISVVAPSDFTVLIEGETGVGKELVARTLHQQSNRSNGPLVYVNCAALPENLVESELFGHVKGAFTGAERNRAGKFSLANGGTLFLDEVGELPMATQSKLLRALQSQEIQPVGQDEPEYVDVRVLAATNRQLKHEIERGQFREDLFHRLSMYPLQVPALRERTGDITLLAGYFAEQTRRKLGLQQLLIDNGVVARLEAYDWPGNVRELEHIIGRAALRANASRPHALTTIKIEHLEHLAPLGKSSSSRTPSEAIKEPDFSPTVPISLKTATEQFQRNLILKQLQDHQGNWSATARALEMDRANLSRLAKRLGIAVKKIVHQPSSNVVTPKTRS